MNRFKNRKLALFAIGILISTAAAVWTINRSNTIYSKLAIRLSLAHAPLTKVSIQGNEYELAIDLGSKFPIKLSAQALNELKKEPGESMPWKDGKGKPHTYNSYFISDFQLGDVKLDHIRACEITDESIEAGTLWKNKTTDTPNQHLGGIGRPVLQERNLYLDAPNKTLIFCESLQTLKNKKLCPAHLIKVPFSLEKGLSISLELDGSPKIFIIDTGCTITLIRDVHANPDPNVGKTSFSSTTAKSLKIGGVDFGAITLYMYNIAEELPADGILGMDFLEDHPFYIDWKAQEIYFGTW